MTTTNDIVSRALRKARILGHGETAEADDVGAALDDLNMMLAAWKLSGVDIGHTPLALADVFPIADEFEEGAVYMLARRISDDVGFPVGFDSDDFFRKIQSAYASIPEASAPSMLVNTSSQSDRRLT